jgi:hypothetical protein
VDEYIFRWIIRMHDIVCTGDLFTKGAPDLPNAKSNTHVAETHRKERKKAQRIPRVGDNTNNGMPI